MVHQTLRAWVGLDPGRFNGLECAWLGNGLIRPAVTTGRGPRILSWRWRDDANVFAEVPRMVERTAESVYEFLGGHRLWYAPEALERTYWPDLARPEVTTLECGARFAAPPDAAGIARELTCTHDEVWRLHHSDLPVGTEAEALGLAEALRLPPAPPAN